MSNKKVETEEELRARLKEELKAELLAELKEEQEKSSKTDLKGKGIKFESYNDRGIKEATDLLNKDKTFVKKEDGPKMYHLPQASEDESSGTLSIILIVVVIGIIIASYMLLPKVYQWLHSESTPSTYVDPNDDEDEPPVVELEEITLKSDTVKKLTYPVMRNNPYSAKSYYTNSVVNIGDFSNNDLLYNAFIHIYKGNIGAYDGEYGSDYCGDESTKKTFNAKYIDARMNNLFTESVEYEHKTFTVPSTNTKTTYVGTWKYDKQNHRYIYYGDCNPTVPSNTIYYDLRVAYDAKGLEQNTIIEVYYYMGFAKVDTKTKKYTIYSDANMKNSILNGTLKTDDYNEELSEEFYNYVSAKKETGKYKFTFSSDNCSYDNHCFVKGEWVG